MLAAETVDAQASVLSDAVQTSTAVLAGVGGAVVRVGQAVAAFVALGTEADVRAVGVLAGSAIAAGGRDGTFIDIFVTQAASIAQLASAGKVQEVARWRALCTVAALVRSAWVKLSFAVAARVRKLAHALVVVYKVYTRSSVATRSRSAIIDIQLEREKHDILETKTPLGLMGQLAIPRNYDRCSPWCRCKCSC